MARSGKVWAIMQLSTAMALAGSSVVVGKTLAMAMPVFVTTFASLLVAWLAILPLAWQRRKEIYLLSRREWGYLFLQGVCGIVLFRVFLLSGLRHIDAARAGIITGTTPAVLTMLAWLMLGERPGKTALAAVVCAMFGGVNLASPGMAGESHNVGIGSLLVFCAVVCEALFSIFRKRVASTVSATVNTAMLIFCALLATLPLAIWDLSGTAVRPTAAILAAILYYGAIATVLAYLLWTGGVGKVSGATAGAACAAMPASTVLLAALVLGEPLHASHLIGCGLVMTGIALAALPTGSRENRSSGD